MSVRIEIGNDSSIEKKVEFRQLLTPEVSSLFSYKEHLESVLFELTKKISEQVILDD